MIEFKAINYRDLTNETSTEIYSLRKKVFKDRLNWQVKCTEDMEFDEYDNENTTYIMGVCEEEVACSLRLIETKFPTMIMGTFLSFFNNITLPTGHFIEASRFFVDKTKIKELNISKEPVTTMLYLTVINYAIENKYEGIYAIVSHSMMMIIKKSGWQISVVEKGISEKRQRVYLIFLPTDKINQQILCAEVYSKTLLDTKDLAAVPLCFYSQDDSVISFNS
ncbi:acyl-homoserine-lactone synthase [Rouxiella sp. T17]|uniref:acyl-homoserine-lactone synthase n=1 Tax=Rouxiella sp. T17 TaxID=3085684 RepID=UPI002FCC3220